MKIQSVGYLEYLIAYESCRSRMSDYFFRNRENTLRILGACDEDGEGQGLLLYERRGGWTEICWVGVRHPGQGVGTALLTFLIEQECSEGRHILLRAGHGSESGRILSHMAEKQGFSLKDKVELFRSGPEDIPRWKNYMEHHGTVILNFLKEQGFHAIPFTEVKGELWKTLKDRLSTDFDVSLDPLSVMNGRKGMFNREVSYLSVKDGEPAAYCLVCQPDAQDFVFEVISAADRFQNMGVILQPLALSIEKTVEYPFRQIGFAMYEKNRKAIALSKRMMKNFVSVREIQYNYEL